MPKVTDINNPEPCEIICPCCNKKFVLTKDQITNVVKYDLRIKAREKYAKYKTKMAEVKETEKKNAELQTSLEILRSKLKLEDDKSNIRDMLLNNTTVKAK